MKKKKRQMKESAFSIPENIYEKRRRFGYD